MTDYAICADAAEHNLGCASQIETGLHSQVECPHLEALKLLYDAVGAPSWAEPERVARVIREWRDRNRVRA